MQKDTRKLLFDATVVVLIYPVVAPDFWSIILCCTFLTIPKSQLNFKFWFLDALQGKRKQRKMLDDQIF